MKEQLKIKETCRIHEMLNSFFIKQHKESLELLPINDVGVIQDVDYTTDIID